MAVMAAMKGFIGGFDAFFALRQFVLTLSAIFCTFDGEEFFAIEGSLAN